METAQWTKKMVVAGFKQLSIVEGIRYPIFFFLVLLSAFIGIVFVAQYLSKKNSYLLAMKESFYSKKWLVISVASINGFLAILDLIFPVGVLSTAFFGDLLMWLFALGGSVLLIIDCFTLSKANEDSQSSSSGIYSFVQNYLWLYGFMFLGVTLLHLVFGVFPVI